MELVLLWGERQQANKQEMSNNGNYHKTMSDKNSAIEQVELLIEGGQRGNTSTKTQMKRGSHLKLWDLFPV